MSAPESASFRSPAKREALLAPFEIPMGHPLSCDHYFPLGDVVGRLYGEAQFELTDLATFHRAAMATAQNLDKHLEQVVANLGGRPSPPRFNDEDSEGWEELQWSRAQTYIMDTDSRIASIVGYADELCIIGLWAHAEKFLGKILVALTGAEPAYQWDEFVRAFGRAGISLAKLPGHDGANECRLLNNALKHGGAVTAALAKSETFVGKEGKSLRELAPDPQPYLLAVHHLIGSLLEVSAQKLGDGEEPRPWRTDSFGRRMEHP